MSSERHPLLVDLVARHLVDPHPHTKFELDVVSLDLEHETRLESESECKPEYLL